MTIRNYTFFSPNGTEFPVTANSDAKLYMLLAGNDYSQFIIKHWSEPVKTGLNKIYADTSVLLGGRYFELNNEPVSLSANSVNYIHANIDPSNIIKPVTLTTETANNSNSININSGNGIIKHLIDIVTTDATSITKSEAPEQGRNFNAINALKSNIKTLDVSDNVDLPVATTPFKMPYMNNDGSRLVRTGNFVILDGTFTSPINKGAGSLISPNDFAGSETIPLGYRPIQAKDICFYNLWGYNGEKSGRVKITTDGRFTDMYLFNNGINTTNKWMFDGACWMTTEPFPTKDKIN